ncbi:HAD family phosphatase [Cereibacter azotoformans]|uniref:HAD family phosphatase n=1 Tax=Cereibacter sphaeroides (strain ATCC 17025 / ATH 2.4.3) TaxID=349102 RepID=A4WYI3_CERS5|nr:HAD family phosphatase [Cereibacter azotoformans]ULB11899.1 HAD family phosphatase [Cereibacter azotoformans]
MSPVRAVIFDLDGCLVDSEPHSLAALVGEMQTIGLPRTTVEEVRERFLGVSMADICRDIERRTGGPVPADFIDRVEARLFRAYALRLRPMAGADRLLDRLEVAGLAMAIATGGSVRRMHETLRLGGLASRFAGRAFSADEVPRGKPAPDLFLKAAAVLGVPPDRCAVLEDSPHGIAGACAAGMRAVGFTGGSHLEGLQAAHRGLLLEAGASQVVGRLDEAFAALCGP